MKEKAIRCKCGGNPTTINDGTFSVCCFRCDSSTGTFTTEEEAIKAWNRMQQTSFKDVRIASGMGRTEFADYFNIPYRTVQSWELGDRKCPEYLLELIQYKLQKEKELNITFDQVKNMEHIWTVEDEYNSLYKNKETGEEYLITSDDENDVLYVCKVLN